MTRPIPLDTPPNRPRGRQGLVRLQRDTEEQLRRSEVRFSILVDSVKDYAIFMLSPDGIVLTWNQGARQLKGYAPDEIIGQSFERFYTAEDRAIGKPRQLLARALADGRVEQEGWRVRKDGSLFWADVVITALTDSDGNPIGFAKVTRDLTERRRAEQESARRLAAERAAERLSRLQTATAALAAASRLEDIDNVLIETTTDALGAASALVARPDAEELDLEPSRAQDERVELPESMLQAWRTSRPQFNGPWAAIPLLVDQRVVAVLALCFDTQVTLDEEQRGMLLALCEVGAQAIDRAAAHESERRARAEAEDAVRAQDEFLSIASHELRTPVTAVKATAQLLQRAIDRNRLDSAYAMRHLSSIARAADRLGMLVEDLLDISRLRTGQLKLRPKVLELGGLIHEVVGRYIVTEPGHTFELQLPPTEHVLVEVDPVRFEQILDNLLSNAVKYSPRGGTVEVSMSADETGVQVEVRDHGIGLPPGQESRIFEPFGRASNATAEQIPGLGLGLAICRQLLEEHGGRIWATSPGERQGTTLHVWLPRAAQATTE